VSDIVLLLTVLSRQCSVEQHFSPKCLIMCQAGFIDTSYRSFGRKCCSVYGGTAAAAPPPSGLVTLPSVGAVP